MKKGDKLYFVNLREKRLDVVNIIESNDEMTKYTLGEVEIKTSTRNLRHFYITKKEAQEIAMESSIKKTKANERMIESLNRKNELLKEQQNFIWKL